ncbi:MAG: hypothetical protein GC168_08070 [Candidatus Hydrogenedens sp.]|nr:hypothetical protein [Candidatus Hydrogenedens sp.]
MLLKKFAFLLGLLVLGAFAVPSFAETPRILYVGDSWTYYPWALQDPPALREVLARPEVGLGEYVEDGSIALLQPTAAGWDTPESKAAIAQKLTENPTIDTVHLSLGGNDVNLGLGGNFSPEHIADMNGTAVQHIANIIDFILAQRPDMRVAICGYDYLNIFEGIKFNGFGVVESIENPTAVAYALYGLSGATIIDAANNQNTINDIFIDLEQRKLNLAQGRDRVQYIHSFGVMQAFYGIPSLSIAPTAPSGLPVGLSGGYSNFPAGNRDLFSPRQALDGDAELDPIHLNPSGYTHLMENAVLQVYAGWLGDSTAPAVQSIAPSGAKAMEGGTVDFDVTFTEPVTGVDAGDFTVYAEGVADAQVASVSGNGANYVVTVTYGAGYGTLRLDLADNDSIYDAVWNPLGKTNLVSAAGDGNFAAGTPAAVTGANPEGEGSVEGVAEGEGSAEGITPDGEGAQEGAAEGEGTSEGGGPVCVTPPKTKRVLIVGDSWTAGIWAVKAMDEVFDEYGLTHVGAEGSLTAQSGSRAAQWANDNTFKNYIFNSLAANPTIDTVHLVIGGNDILSRIKNTNVYSGLGALQREGWWNTIQNDIQTIVNYCLSFPQVQHVLINDYDYLNALTAKTVLGLLGQSYDFGGMSQEQVNNAFIEVGLRKLSIAQNTPGCEYVQNWGILQHHFQTPAGGALPGAAPGYTPYPGGFKAFPMPDAAFDPIVFGPLTFAGDGIHPNENAHKVMLCNAVDQFYYGWFAPEIVCTEEGETTVEGEGIVDGEGIAEGEGVTEGAVEAEIVVEGEGASGGEIAVDGEGSVEGEGSSEGTAGGEVSVDGEGSAGGEVTLEGEGGHEAENSNEGEVNEGEPEGSAGGEVSEGEGAPEGTAEAESTEGEGGGEPAEGEETAEGEGETPGHSADTNHDGRIDLAELLRCIQLYNFREGFHCTAGEDGFGLGDGDRQGCGFHSLDFMEPRWIITLSELLRGVQLYNLGEIEKCGTSEDGYCPRETR